MNGYGRIRLRKFILKNNIEVLHVHDLYMSKAAHSGIKRSGNRIPMILDLHENYPFTITTYNWTKGFFRSLISKPEIWQQKEKEYLEYADRIIVLSSDYRDLLIYRYPEFSDDLFTVLPNVPELLNLPDKNIKKADNPFRQDYPIMLYYGVIAERRGVFDSLEVFSKLVEENFLVNFLLIGPVDKSDNSRFQNYLKRDILSGRIHYIPWIDSSELPSYLQLVDICLAPFHKNPQHESGVANKIYEYMLGSKPLIVSDCLPQQTLVEKHECGLVFHNMQEFQTAIIKLAGNVRMRKQMGKNGVSGHSRKL